jgi:molecular chaperone GrpE
MDEEKRQENAQESEANAEANVSETVEQVGSEPMSAESNQQNNMDVKLEGTPNSQPGVEATEAEFTLDPEMEPFDLSPDEAGTAQPQSEAVSSPSSAEVEELNQRIEALKAQLEDRNNQYMRLAADFENYRKRTQKEKEDQEQFVKAATIKELLSVVDNFERARSQIKPQTEEESAIHKSYQGIYKDFVDRLKKIGVGPMRVEGEVFDPSLHEAVMREETTEYPEGTITEELRRGYILGELVLRHAMVKVATNPGDSMSETSE